MDDRQGLLAAITAQRGEDAPRLMLADWLDEHGTTDQDAARAEYIRLSCGVGYGGDGGRSKVRLGIKEGKWLDANWKRLVPNLVACATPELWLPKDHSDTGLVAHAAGGITATRSGRKMSVRLWWRWDSRWRKMASRYSGFTIHLWFWRGFLDHFDVYGVRQLYLVGGIVAQDDQLTEVRFMNQEIVWDRQPGRPLLATIHDNRIGPLFPFIQDYECHRTAHPDTGTAAKFFERRPVETEEECFGRAGDSIHAAATDWMRASPGVSLRSVLVNHGPTRYEPVKLPLNDAAPWPDSPPPLSLNPALFAEHP